MAIYFRNSIQQKIFEEVLKAGGLIASFPLAGLALQSSIESSTCALWGVYCAPGARVVANLFRVACKLERRDEVFCCLKFETLRKVAGFILGYLVVFSVGNLLAYYEKGSVNNDVILLLTVLLPISATLEWCTIQIAKRIICGDPIPRSVLQSPQMQRPLIREGEEDPGLAVGEGRGFYRIEEEGREGVPEPGLNVVNGEE